MKQESSEMKDMRNVQYFNIQVIITCIYLFMFNYFAIFIQLSLIYNAHDAFLSCLCV